VWVRVNVVKSGYLTLTEIVQPASFSLLIDLIHFAAGSAS
jgi:hypothetical protein